MLSPKPKSHLGHDRPGAFDPSLHRFWAGKPPGFGASVGMRRGQSWVSVGASHGCLEKWIAEEVVCIGRPPFSLTAATIAAASSSTTTLTTTPTSTTTTTSNGRLGPRTLCTSLPPRSYFLCFVRSPFCQATSTPFPLVHKLSEPPIQRLHHTRTLQSGWLMDTPYHSVLGLSHRHPDRRVLAPYIIE